MNEEVYYSKVYTQTLKAFRDDKIRIIVNMGGTRSGKTYSILQLLNDICGVWYKGLVTSVVTQTFPQLRVGALRDYQRIVEGMRYEENKSEHSFKLFHADGGSSLMEFFSADQYLKVLGGQRDLLFVNECVRLQWETVRQMMVRTSWKVFFDLNPIYRFWLNDKILTRDDVAVIHSTYKDNDFLSEAQKKEIESHQKDENWWRVYGLGLEGKAEGLVYPEWDIVPEMPKECKVRYGIDFGYNDPTTLIKVGVTGQDLYIEEKIYKRGIITDDLDILLEQCGLHRRQEKIIYDSAAKEQGETLFRRGWNTHPSVKGGGSILAGISRVKKYNIHIVAPSNNLQNEMLNYMWEKDKNDNTMDVPIDGFNHCFVGETQVLTGEGLQRIDSLKVGDMIATSAGWKRCSKFFNNGVQKTLHIKLIFSNFITEIQGTPDHKIKTKEGWKDLQNLQAGDTLYLNKLLRGNNTHFIRERGTISEEENTCTGLYGSSIREQSPKGMTSTIKTETYQTTPLKTLCSLVKQNTKDSTQRKEGEMRNGLRRCESEWTMQGDMQISGTGQRRAKNGILYKERKSLQISHSKHSLATIAEQSSNQKNITPDSVPTNAKVLGGGEKRKITSQRFARYAEKSSPQTGFPAQLVAVESVLQSIEVLTVEERQVYDIEVEESHEFFANGVLVHNCLDPARYALQDLEGNSGTYNIGFAR